MSIEDIRKGYLSREKCYIKGSEVGPRGGASPHKNLFSTPPPPPPLRIDPIEDKISKLVMLLIIFDYYATVFMLKFKAF